jgi:uncharacterized membrane protein
MISTKEMQNIMGMILLTGTIISVILVIIGGTMFLAENSNMLLKTELLSPTHYHINFIEMHQFLHQHTSIGLIELGLLCLVMTQLVRVALLIWFYIMTRDWTFSFISLFILCVLVYSILWQPYHGLGI